MNVPERLGRIATYMWILAGLVVMVLGIQNPELFTQENMAELMGRWGPWAFAAFVVVSLVRGFLLIPSTPVILAGGLLFPDALLSVFLVSMAGIAVSATAIYHMPGFGGFDARLEQAYPAKIARIKDQLTKPLAFWFVVGWSFFPLVPTDVICYAAGLAQMSYRRMIIALFLGEIPLVTGYLVLTHRVTEFLG